MTHFTFASTLLLLLAASNSAVLASKECSPGVTDSVKAMLDNGNLYRTCAVDNAGVRFDVDSLFDVLDLSERNFLFFCRSSNCIEPVKNLLHSTSTDCLIKYHGSARNVSDEVSTLYHQCAKVVGAADKTDEEYVYRYFLD